MLGIAAPLVRCRVIVELRQNLPSALEFLSSFSWIGMKCEAYTGLSLEWRYQNPGNCQ